MARVLIPLPDRDFDVTEVAVPWRMLRDAGHEVVFATEEAGTRPAADPLLLTGVLFGRLGAEPEPKAFYAELTAAPEFRAPIAWREIEPGAFDALLLAGGHAPGMRQYLGSSLLQSKVATFWGLERLVGAICHGVVVLARARQHDRSVLYDRQTTCLPKYLERLAYYSTAWKLGKYYRTYPTYVEDEVRSALREPKRQFERGPMGGGARDSRDDLSPSFVVEDGTYLSARWPGDAYAFGRRFVEKLDEA
ncbi:MAG: DJ-1/PfpI family protein [Deltaproteobacteria bacterium]|nr:DJ-1/PfpI family protein [Deltaproteobacteria bacterium]